MRFAILGISHETNTFSRVPADYSQFEKSHMLRGTDIVRHFGQASYTVSGYLEACGELGVEAVPLMYATTGPIGTITRDAYDRISSEMLGMLQKQGPWDAVLIANHGAAVAEHHPDMDGEFCRAVREIVGPKMPVGVTLDMHANVSAQVVKNTTVCVVWRTNPHLDPKLRGKKTAQLIHRTVKGEIRPVQHIETPPLVVNIVRQFTGELPMKALVDDAVEANRRPKILDTSVAEGYPYADVAQMGMAFVAIADGDQKAAQDAARWMAERAWARREELNRPIPGIREALKMAQERYAGPRPRGEEDPAPSDGSPLMALDTHSPSTGSGRRRGPIVLMDVGDNIGGGSSADSTHILHEARAMGVKSLLQSLYDPEAVQACVKAGVGANVTLDVGGKTDDMHGKPIKVTGTVRILADGKFEETLPNHGGGRYFDQGTVARVDTADGWTLVLTSRRFGNTARHQHYSIGIRPEEYQVVVAKGVVSPRPAYQPIAGEIILVNTPGVTTADLSTFNYRRRRRPLYPFEQDARYP
jgi:microcystin degradation protein MlrC